MTTGFLLLNDTALTMQSAAGSVHEEPGFARVTDDGIETGETARATAWQEPQHSYNQYWVHLNQVPLASRERWARHHADLAFAQLRSLWHKADGPESLVLLVPGSFSDEQLSLILGLCQALPAEVVAMADSALAAAGHSGDEDFVWLELLHHQAVATRCRVRSGVVTIKAQEVFPNIGIAQLHNTVARLVSNQLIDSARYDPLHSSTNEQAIFDRAPQWLTSLRFEAEVSDSLDTPKGRLPFIVRQGVLGQMLRERLESLESFLGRHEDATLLVSNHCASLLPYAPSLAPARIVGRDEPFAFVARHLDAILEQSAELHRVQSLALDDRSLQTEGVNGRAATHLLYGDRAWSLAQPLSLSVDEHGLRLSAAVDPDAGLTIVMREGMIEELRRDPQIEAVLPSQCSPGESLRLAGHELKLIEVRRG